LLLKRLQLLGREDDILIFSKLVTLDRVVAGDDLVVLGTRVLLLEARIALLVQHVERDGCLRLRGRIEIDRDGDEPEGDRGRGDRTRRHSGAGWGTADKV